MKIPRLSGHPPRTFVRLPAPLLAVDPGTRESGYVVYDPNNKRILEFGKCTNQNLMLRILAVNARPALVVCEEIRSYGMPVGATTLDTVRFTGRLEQLCLVEQIPFRLISRQQVKNALKPLPRRNDRDVRAALIKIYGDPGTSKARGKTYGITKDVWAALGVAHAYRRHLIDESRHSNVPAAPRDD